MNYEITLRLKAQNFNDSKKNGTHSLTSKTFHFGATSNTSSKTTLLFVLADGGSTLEHKQGKVIITILKEKSVEQDNNTSKKISLMAQFI